jgi:hypothetical protein
LQEGVTVPDPFTKAAQYLASTGGFVAVGLTRTQRVAIQFSAHDGLLRIPPYLLLRDIDEAIFAIFLNRLLADKLQGVSVYANEYKLAEYPRSCMRIEAPPRTFRVPMCFDDAELADGWVRVMNDLSPFRISFSDTTPQRGFPAVDVGDSPKH